MRQISGSVLLTVALLGSAGLATACAGCALRRIRVPAPPGWPGRCSFLTHGDARDAVTGEEPEVGQAAPCARGRAGGR
jgi:hypothetical protein